MRKYTDSELIEIALKLGKDSKKIQEYDSSVYRAIIRYGLQKECFIGYTSRNSPGTWTYDKCKEEIESGKYKSTGDLETRCPGCWKAIRRNAWNNLTEPLKVLHTRTFEECLEIAKSYEYTADFKREDRKVYSYIVRHKWSKECFSHLKHKGNLMSRGVYAYEFPDYSVYVGLTCTFERRHHQHMTEDDSAVYRYIQKTSLVPIKKIISDYIEVYEAAKLEGETLEKYKAEGWNILNISSTGGLGGFTSKFPRPRIKWTDEAIIENAKTYNTYSEWRTSNGSSYDAALKYKMLDKIKELKIWK